MAISAQAVKQLKELTNCGMMDCKRALEETNGDVDAAIKNPVSYTHLCLLGWLCIVQSLWAYTPGVRAGAKCGATAPRPCLGLRPCDPIFI